MINCDSANLIQMIIEDSMEKTASKNNSWRSGLLQATSMENLNGDELKDQVGLLNSQSEYCGSSGSQWELVAGHWCQSDTFQLLNLIFLLIYVLDVVFKVYLSVIYAFLTTT